MMKTFRSKSNSSKNSMLMLFISCMLYGMVQCEEDDLSDLEYRDGMRKLSDPLEFSDNHFINLSLHEMDTILMFVDEDKLEEPYMKVFR